MNSIIILTIVSLGMVALVSAIILFFVARKFHVQEDPRLDLVVEILPSANCGGCGYAGCRNFAEAMLAVSSLDGLSCPVGGAEVMNKAAAILGMTAPEFEPLVAVLRCNGTRENIIMTSHYDGPADCGIAHMLYGGEKGCTYGCLGHGDCVKACTFGALTIDAATGLPVVDDDKCTACGKCVQSCPRGLFELRKKAKKNRKLYVACSNCDKGGVARKSCRVACIACTKCQQVCESDAITIERNLAYIDASKCTFCRKCVQVCPTASILEFNFPAKKTKMEMEAAGSE